MPPVTPVIDNFARADGGLGANWTADPFGSGNAMPQILSGQVRNNAGVGSEAWYNVATFGPNSEAYITLPTAGSGEHSVGLRLQTPGSAACDGYTLYHNGTTNYNLIRFDNGVATILGANPSLSQTMANGDATMFRAVGSTLELHYKPSAGAWPTTPSATRTDATYGAAGFMSLFVGASTTVRLDDFGGGTHKGIVYLPPAQGLVHLRR